MEIGQGSGGQPNMHVDVPRNLDQSSESSDLPCLCLRPSKLKLTSSQACGVGGGDSVGTAAWCPVGLGSWAGGGESVTRERGGW